MPSKYSGRTTCYEHKREGWEKIPAAGKDCIRMQTVFDVQWSNCPVEIENEVKQLWLDNELNNDICFYSWTFDDEECKQYPLIAEYLKSRDVNGPIWIHWWW